MTGGDRLAHRLRGGIPALPRDTWWSRIWAPFWAIPTAFFVAAAVAGMAPGRRVVCAVDAARATGGDVVAALSEEAAKEGARWAEAIRARLRGDRGRRSVERRRAIVETLRANGVRYLDEARQYQPTPWTLQSERQPFPHQSEALEAWWQHGGRGVVVLPTGTGKTFVALLAIARAGRPTLVVTPTIDLMNQWYGELSNGFGGTVGLLGGGHEMAGVGVQVAAGGLDGFVAEDALQHVQWDARVGHPGRAGVAEPVPSQ